MIFMISRVLTVCATLATCVAVSPAPAEAEATPGAIVSAVPQAEGAQRPLPAGVRSEKVTFAGNDIKLAGTVYIPKLVGGKRAPAVLLVSGSSLRSRGVVTIARAPSTGFEQLAAFLSNNGLVVMTYDSECNGGSECKREATPQDYAADAVAAFRYIANRPEVDAAKVIVLGHDEGGSFASSVAGNLPADEGKLLGVVLVAMPGRTYGKVLRDQAERRLAAAGRSTEDVRSYLSRFDLVANALASGVVDLKAAKVDETDPLFSQFPTHRQYLFHLFVNDPLQIVRGVECPVLIVQGEKDAHMGVRDAQYLREAVDRQFNRDLTLELLPEMDHWMRAQKGPTAFRDEETSGPLDPAFTRLLSGWISKRVK